MARLVHTLNRVATFGLLGLDHGSGKRPDPLAPKVSAGADYEEDQEEDEDDSQVVVRHCLTMREDLGRYEQYASKISRCDSQSARVCIVGGGGCRQFVQWVTSKRVVAVQPRPSSKPTRKPAGNYTLRRQALYYHLEPACH